MKNNILIVLLSFVLLGFVTQPTFANNDNTAKISAVKKMYAFYNMENEYMLPREFFTESLRNLMRRQDHYNADHIGELYECTESGVFAISELDYQNQRKVFNSGIYTVLASGNVKVILREKTQYGTAQEVNIFKIKKENGSWKIDDMLSSQDGSSFKQTANACLKRFGY